jgi:GNAT superfamily N-acetyltransferase
VSQVRITPYLAAALTEAQAAELDGIFFTSSATQSFADAGARAAFRERWLGRYLTYNAADAFLAIDVRDRIVGYVVGTIEDLATLPRFADLGSARTFAALSALYPAHLHINVALDWRSAGLGAQLIETFTRHARAQGAVGAHVVTNPTSRNIGFYNRCGFAEIGRAPAGGAEIVFLGKALRD